MSTHAVPQESHLTRPPKQTVRSQTELIRKNISAVTEAQKDEVSRRSTLDRLADGVTNFSGSMLFVFIHVVWFGFWVLLNVGLIKIRGLSDFDPFPFGLLTMVVSLEAIFLSTFVLISQNRMARLSERRAELDLHVNLLAEQKATKALEMLDQIIEQLNSLKRFNFERDPEVEALKVSPEPQEVLRVMKEAVAEEADAVKREVKAEVGKVVEEISGEFEAVREDVREISGEFKAVHEEVEEAAQEAETASTKVSRVDHKVEAIAADVREIKEEVGAR